MNSSRPLFSPDMPTGGPPPSPGRQRPSSLSLRGAAGTQGEAPQSEGLDPANQSLADALRVTLRIVQVGMLVLAALFAISGSQSVRENGPVHCYGQTLALLEKRHSTHRHRS